MGLQMRNDMEKRLLWLHMHQAERGLRKPNKIRIAFKLFCLIALSLLGAVYFWATLAFVFAITP